MIVGQQAFELADVLIVERVEKFSAPPCDGVFVVHGVAGLVGRQPTIRRFRRLVIAL
jgi:hypothetical protein